MALMVIIETVRNLIRPGALAVRLAANIVAGHLLLSLLGGQTNSVISVIIGLLLLLVVLECAVACIQSYVFTILRTLYLNEIMHRKFNKSIL
jgi:F-type H+-transporting ATPase subunit a